MLRSGLSLALVTAVVACSGAASEDEPSQVSPPEAPPGTTNPDGTPKPPQATCTARTNIAISVEERRLTSRLPGKTVAFAQEILEGTGFDRFAPDFAAELCKDGKAGASTFEDAKALVTNAGARLWRAAVDRVQGKTTSGPLPAGDDRMLYWARLEMTKTLRAWGPSFPLSDGQRADLEWELERASRGQYDLTLPPGEGYIRIVVSGFDPFGLGEPGTESIGVRTGNPSGAAALALDGYEVLLPNGKRAHLETFVLPVSYGPFERGMEEDTVGPLLKPGPARADVVITMSQGGGYRFKLEEFNGRYHGTVPGNDDVATCDFGLASTEGCNIHPPERWLGHPSRPWQRDDPPQFVDSTLPVAAMIAANTGAQVPRPPDSAASPGSAFDVVWGYDYDLFPDCNAPPTQSFYDPVSPTYPPPESPIHPAAGTCARSGGGGDYLSNESAYRATLLRQTMGLVIPVGHIHTPIMSRFLGDASAVTDAKFEQYRSAIVHQARLLVEAAAKAL